MSIQTRPIAPALDATDFQFTHLGTTIGVELRYVVASDGEPIASAVVCELSAAGVWDVKATLAREFLSDLNTRGAMAWLRDVLIPAINVWLRVRFSGSSTPASPVLPTQLVELDRLMATIQVALVDGVPQVHL